MMTKSTLFLLLPVFLAGCVNVKLSPGGGTKRAEGVEYRAPSGPFKKQSRDDVDAAWKNNSNGNVISFLTDCMDPSDPGLDSVVSGVIGGLSELKTESRDVVKVQGREGRRVVATGMVDGVNTQIDLLVFKRNQCIYILNYVGVQTAFASDRTHFNRFIEGFRAP